MMVDALIVLDIGKTNAKLALIDAGGNVLAEQRRPNTVRTDGPYAHLDTDGLWDWLLATCRAFAARAHVSAIVPVTHGATAALVDDAGLVLPVLDYEAELPGVEYAGPSYEETLSPRLPAGLNLGRQLAWLQARFPREFARTKHILMYPQYWAWRLCGVAASEATSLGCHTDLWNPRTQAYSSLVGRMGWTGLMPPLAPAHAVLGVLLPEIADATGLPRDCQVVCGIHDSNASLLRYLGRAEGTVLSTGTWMIAAAFGTALDGLRERADMLANTNALGQPVACMRFMGGREFGELAGAQPVTCGFDDIERLVAQGTLALPCFAATGGPFAGRTGSIDGPPPADAQERYALATLYCVLMTDYCLDALGAAGPLAVEGSFTANPWFGPLLAALRPQQPVSYSDDASGTTCGGWMLRYRDAAAPGTSTAIAARVPAGLDGYRARWRDSLA
ncbi:FGGY family carbohydrate kinase [Telluria mixta]|uniref:FGGY family carbohydrate kinase n=1 Tax=Telluria mixta TaxID=34071 RepID=A0ABT2BY96_9BURK|nr:FGGY family carbohydrate kinase [Telluria mixta]MCS0630116.1 FGGY family carbohydrate kinase [Telluria mixta]WEM94570.1 FGGY family carbohydrate kinase [Telluria mixta]